MTSFINLMLRSLLRLQALLPLSLIRLLGRVFGLLNFTFRSRSSEVTRVNLETCFPELSSAEISSLALDSMRHTGMAVFETPSVWLLPREKTSQWITRVEDESLLDSAMRAEAGTVDLLPHLGNCEMFNI